MKSISLGAATAVALLLGATGGYAQTPQKEQAPEATPGSKAGQAQQQRAPDADAKGQAERKGKADKGTAQKDTAPKDKSTKGSAQKDTAPKDKSTKGSAQKDTAPKDKSTKGSAQKDVEPKDKATKGSAQQKDTAPAREKSAGDKSSPADKGTAKAGTQPRAELSEQQQTRVRESVLKEKGPRVTSVDFSVRVGTRVPRTVQLAVLPAAVVEIVPAYRGYRYFVVRDDIVIVDPDTYEIVYVVAGRGSTAGGPGLTLTDEQIAFVLRNVDLKSESSLGIGGLSVGTKVSRDDLRSFPSVVVAKLPQLSSYRYLVHENEVAFVEQDKLTVELVADIPR